MRSILLSVILTTTTTTTAFADAVPRMSQAEHDSVLNRAKDHARASRFAEARRDADALLTRFDDNDTEALSVAALSACNLLDRAGAKRYIGKLHGPRRLMMQQICETKGLSLDLAVEDGPAPLPGKMSKA